MIKYIFASEFDILQGCVVRSSYPKQENYNCCILSSYMLPDGVHKYEYDYSIFKYRFLNQDLYDLI